MFGVMLTPVRYFVILELLAAEPWWHSNSNALLVRCIKLLIAVVVGLGGQIRRLHARSFRSCLSILCATYTFSLHPWY